MGKSAPITAERRRGRGCKFCAEWYPEDTNEALTVFHKRMEAIGYVSFPVRLSKCFAVRTTLEGMFDAEGLERKFNTSLPKYLKEIKSKLTCWNQEFGFMMDSVRGPDSRVQLGYLLGPNEVGQQDVLPTTSSLIQGQVDSMATPMEVIMFQGPDCLKCADANFNPWKDTCSAVRMRLNAHDLCKTWVDAVDQCPT